MQCTHQCERCGRRLGQGGGAADGRVGEDGAGQIAQGVVEGGRPWVGEEAIGMGVSVGVGGSSLEAAGTAYGAGRAVAYGK